MSEPASILGSVRVGTLTLELVGLRNLRGVVNLGLFDSPEGFPNVAAQAVRSGCFEVSASPLILTFPDLPFGRYAATVHHDENQDGILNVNSLGIPKEGIGFSSDPKIWLGAPPFHKAAFDFTPESRSLTITMKYLLP
ncbi:MAG: DUF2141 domain-containing protein [Drouetiella hepatica Uher 2000/2452]|jgi:uncharacterized protein (DUF2141 family)|uniref:DUF2141 domain-containing protein n=1 Tax=Drouetiella hepatica Uher 2000/2452 TaxID=904376 RepID=A0A951QBM0_9CYAN|nr:DUF2141 domain-containing protein [Drouetiella hepatica Uher 2000/2452]